MTVRLPDDVYLDRFAKNVEEAEDGCWIWTGGRIRNGYGSFYFEGRSQGAHRLAYEWLVGPIPSGLQLDHLCRNPPCVNPAHLDVVTSAVNTRRGVSPAAVNAKKTHCKHGHEFTPENTVWRKDGQGRRLCRTCMRRSKRTYYARSGRPKPKNCRCCNVLLTDDNADRRGGGRWVGVCRDCSASVACSPDVELGPGASSVGASGPSTEGGE